MKSLDKLRDGHPRLFRGELPPWSDLPPGWFSLVDELCTSLECSMTDEELSVFRVTQIKEKFGGLRFYYQGKLTDEIAHLIDDAEAQSERTCMECGEPGRIRNGSWIVTLCDFCEKERQIRARRTPPSNA